MGCVVQVRLLCVTDDVIRSAEATAQTMREAGIRVQVESGESRPPCFGLQRSVTGMVDSSITRLDSSHPD